MTINVELYKTILEQLSQAQDCQSGINAALKTFGEYLNVSRIYILENGLRNAQVSYNTYEWCAEGIESYLEIRQNVPCIDNSFYNAIKSSRLHSFNDIKKVPIDSFDGYVVPDVKSGLYYPIKDYGYVWGVIGIEDFKICHPEWDGRKDGFESLLSVLDLIAMNLIKDRSYKHAVKANKVAKVFAEEYANVFCVNIKKRTFCAIKVTDGKISTLDKFLDVEYPYERFIEIILEHRVHPEDAAEFVEVFNYDNLLQRLQSSNSFIHNFKVLIKGELHYFQSKSMLIQGEDEIYIGCRFVDDIIEKEAKERKLVEEALAVAEHATKAKTTFLNNMSHDIRTPMNAILGFTTLASTHIDDKLRVADSLKKIQNSSNHLLSLINDILDMSRMEAGKIRLHEKENSMLEVMSDVKNIVQADLKRKRLQSVFEIDVKNKYVWCDKLRLDQVLLNFLTNSIKYTLVEGKVEMYIKELPCQAEDFGTYEITIRDNGIGMSKEFLDNIFEPFHRENNTTMSGSNGTGLGMTISKNMIDMMGGTIQIKSEKGEGTEIVCRFTFKLADSQDIEDVVEKLEKDNPAQTVYDLTGKKILIVEDNETNRMIAEVLLTESGAVVDSVNDGVDAVEKMKTVEPDTYDVILMDIQMPIMNGYDATRAIRALPNAQIASIPIIALTANALDEDRQQSAAAGMNAHIAKPFDIGIMVETINNIVEKETYKKIALRDKLTGLYNRHFIEIWKKRHEENPVYPVTFIVADGNNLKSVNDTYGHEAGDNHIKLIGQCLLDNFTADKCSVIRIGGDEYLILCRGVSSEEAMVFLDNAKEEGLSKLNHGVAVSFSAGIFTFDSEDEYDYDLGVKNADMNMLLDKENYHTRRSGR